MNLLQRHITVVSGAAGLLILCLVACWFEPGMASLRVGLDLLNGNAALGLVAIGMTFVLLSGGVDLSVGSVYALSGMIVARMIGAADCHPAWAYLSAMASGVAIGAAQGWLIVSYRLAPFIATLGGMFVARGTTFLVGMTSEAIDHPFHARWVGFAIVIDEGRLRPGSIVLLTALLLALYVARWTAWGRCVYATGGRELSARLMGLPVARTRISVYAVSGFCAALAGVLRTIEMPAGDPSAGIGLELEAIAATVIGGTLLTGGVGGVGGTLVGVLVVGVVQLWIMFDGRLSSWWGRVATGLLLLLFVVLQRWLIRRTSARM